MKQNIFLVAGGSGGHILPALQLGKDWKQKHNGSLLFIGQHGKLDKALVQRNHIIDEIKLLATPKLSRKKLWLLPFFMLQLAANFFKSFYWLLMHRPQKIVSTGGMLTIPVALAGWLLRTPLELHELNVVPGKAVAFLAPLATTIFTAFSKTETYLKNYKHKCKQKPYPIRFSGNALKQKVFRLALKDFSMWKLSKIINHTYKIEACQQVREYLHRGEMNDAVELLLLRPFCKGNKLHSILWDKYCLKNAPFQPQKMLF